MNQLPDKAHYRVSTIAKYLDYSVSKIYEMISLGDLPSIRAGGSIRIPADLFKKWEQNQRAADHNKLSA